MTTLSQAEKAARFAKLHESGCFVLPNAWDIPSAALVVEAGFPAVATTSSGVACALGFPDGERISRDRMLAVVAEFARRLPVPVTADLEAGYGEAPETVADTVRRAIEAGAVGCNIEDGNPRTGKLFDFDVAVARIEAGVAAARAAGLPDFVLNARTDPYLRGFGTPEQNHEEAVRRANAFLRVGAGCAFVPGPADVETIDRLTRAIDGPMNVLVTSGRRFPSVEELSRAGVRRVSLAGSLMVATYTATRRILEDLAATGSLDYTVGTITGREMNALVAKYS